MGVEVGTRGRRFRGWMLGLVGWWEVGWWEEGWGMRRGSMDEGSGRRKGTKRRRGHGGLHVTGVIIRDGCV